MPHCGHFFQCSAGSILDCIAQFWVFLTTVGMFVANALNLYFGFKASQTKYALLLTPLMVWLVLACCIAGWQFLYTPDEFFQMAPLCHRAP
jgi:hypothetical protein